LEELAIPDLDQIKQGEQGMRYRRRRFATAGTDPDKSGQTNPVTPAKAGTQGSRSLALGPRIRAAFAGTTNFGPQDFLTSQGREQAGAQQVNA